MKVKLIVAESAASHPDNTFSLLRGGVNQLTSDRFPAVFDGALVVRIIGDPSESGTHSLRCVLVDQDGGELSRLEAGFQIPQGGGNSALIVRTSQEFPRPGIYSFRVAVDGHFKDDEAVIVLQAGLPDAMPDDGGN